VRQALLGEHHFPCGSTGNPRDPRGNDSNDRKNDRRGANHADHQRIRNTKEDAECEWA
jgi:hypothetical protein